MLCEIVFIMMYTTHHQLELIMKYLVLIALLGLKTVDATNNQNFMNSKEFSFDKISNMMCEGAAHESDSDSSCSEGTSEGTSSDDDALASCLGTGEEVAVVAETECP